MSTSYVCNFFCLLIAVDFCYGLDLVRSCSTFSNIILNETSFRQEPKSSCNTTKTNYICKPNRVGLLRWIHFDSSRRCSRYPRRYPVLYLNSNLHQNILWQLKQWESINLFRKLILVFGPQLRVHSEAFRILFKSEQKFYGANYNKFI